MKNCFLVVLLLFVSISFAQTVGEINKVLGLPDSLRNEEIRIYKKHEITNGTEIFRLFAVKK